MSFSLKCQAFYVVFGRVYLKAYTKLTAFFSISGLLSDQPILKSIKDNLPTNYQSVPDSFIRKLSHHWTEVTWFINSIYTILPLHHSVIIFLNLFVTFIIVRSSGTTTVSTDYVGYLHDFFLLSASNQECISCWQGDSSSLRSDIFPAPSLQQFSAHLVS